MTDAPAPPPDAPPARPTSRGVVVAVVGLLAAAAWIVGIVARRGGEPAAPPRKTPAPSAPSAPRDLFFRDVAKEAGVGFWMAYLPDEQGENFKINLYDHGAGVAVADVDGDGDDDVYFCNQLGPNALYRNDGGWRFTDVTKAAGVAVDDRISVAAAFGDVDADGDADLYVTTTRGGNVFFRNRGDGTFEDATEAAGLALVAHAQAAAFFDADGDADLDLLVTATAKWTTSTFDPRQRYFLGPEGLFELVDSPPERNAFYRNRGDGTFEDATEAAGLAGPGWSGDVVAFDADDDHDLDVFVTNMFGRSALLQNDGKGRFTDVTAASLPTTSFGTIGARAFDADGDGRLDLLLSDMHSDMWTQAMDVPKPADAPKKWPGLFGPRADPADPVQAGLLKRLGYRVDGVLFGNTFLRALGGGRFEERSDAAGLETWWPWGVVTGDFDADGAEDVFFASGMGYPFEYWPCALLRNDGTGRFADRTADSGVDPVDGRTRGPKLRDRAISRSSRAAATADFDGDGRLDLVVNNFNGGPFLFRNESRPRAWVGVRLVGAGKNRDAIGALARVTAGGRTIVRQVHAASGYLAQSSLALHVGLGDATRIDRCEIRWPDGSTQVVPDLAPGRWHTVRQP